MKDIIFYTGGTRKFVPENFRDPRLGDRFAWTCL